MSVVHVEVRVCMSVSGSNTCVCIVALVPFPWTYIDM